MSSVPDDLPELLGGRLCLDFVNTVHHRYRDDSRDYLEDYASWLRWAVHAHAVTAEEAGRLESRASSEPRLAGRAFDRALAFRSTAYTLLRQRFGGFRPDASLVDHLNELLALAASLRVLVPEEHNWRWSWRSSALDFDQPLYAVALSLADLVASVPPGRVKECPAPDGCGWLFLDETRNASRRWCSMKHCGTTSKVRRYLQRKNAAQVGGAAN